MKKVKIFSVLLGILSATLAQAEEVVAQNFEELLAAVKTGSDVALAKSKVYEVTETIFLQKDGQKIYTKDPERISEYAILKITNPKCGQIINSNSRSNILIEKIILDGNRYMLPPFSGKGEEMVLFGGESKNQTMRNCILVNTRTWSSFKMGEETISPKIENTIIFGSGVDSRGNGKTEKELPFKWGDGITCAAKDAIISNNIIIDATDVGVVLFGAPGASVKNNVIASISRECLGGINIVDGLYCYELDKIETMLEGPDATRKYDYSVDVQHNLIDARGARIHVSVPMGACVWKPRSIPDKLFVGGKVKYNEISGNASAYGFVISDVDKFEVLENKSTGQFSGYADGLRSVLCDEPGAFIYDPKSVSNSKIQKDFKPVERSIEHLLRCNNGPTAVGGYFKNYRAYSYGEHECIAAARIAFVEILGRNPSKLEEEKYSRLLNERQMPADELRYILTKTEEFKKHHGELSRDEMHLFRTSKWLKLFDEEIGTNANWASRDVYKRALDRLKKDSN